MELNYELTQDQKTEFKHADEFGGSSRTIRKHPEWHPNFMNSFWNAQQEGREKEYYYIADYITSHPSKADAKSGKIGADFEYLYGLCRFMDKTNARHPIPEIPLEEDGCVDTSIAKFVLQDHVHRFVEHRQPLYTGRMPIGMDDNSDEIKCLMCEGGMSRLPKSMTRSQLQQEAMQGLIPDCVCPALIGAV